MRQSWTFVIYLWLRDIYHATLARRFQRFSVNVWTGAVGHILGGNPLPSRRLNADIVSGFLKMFRCYKSSPYICDRCYGSYTTEHHNTKGQFSVAVSRDVTTEMDEAWRAHWMDFSIFWTFFVEFLLVGTLEGKCVCSFSREYRRSRSEISHCCYNCRCRNVAEGKGEYCARNRGLLCNARHSFRTLLQPLINTLSQGVKWTKFVTSLPTLQLLLKCMPAILGYVGPFDSDMYLKN